MAIVSVHQLRSFEYSESKGSKGSVDMKGSVELLVRCDAEPDFNEIVNDTTTWSTFYNRKIPQINDSELIGGIPFFVSSRKFAYHSGEDQNRAVKVTIEYDNKREEPQDPDEQKPQDTDSETWKKITVTTEQQSCPLTDEGVDGNLGGKPARNSAGDPVDGLEENRCLVKLTYTNTQVPSPNFAQLLEYVNTTNDGDFLGCPRRTILCQGFNADYDDKRQLWNISVEWLYDPKEHKVEFYDVGFNELVGGQRRAILDIAGNPVSKPVPLMSDGTAVSPSQLAANPDDYMFTRFAYPYKEKTMQSIFIDGGI